MILLPDTGRYYSFYYYYHYKCRSLCSYVSWKTIWKQKIPSRVAFFVWTVALRKCLTTDNLRKRKMWILNWCYMCKRNGESVDHLFLHCPLASDLWSMVLVYGKISVRDGLPSRAIFCMILVMGLEWSFGKIGGVERLLLLLDFLTCSDFAGIRMPVWLSLWCPPMVSSFGMWDSLGGCMLGILRLCLTLW